MQINKSLRTLFTLNSIFVFGGSLFGPLYAIYVQGFDNKIVTVSLSWAVFMISSTLFMYFVAKYGDKIKEKEYLLAGGFLVRSIAWLGYLFVTNITGLIIVQIILGLGEALGTPAWNAIFAKHLDGHKEIMDYSNWNIINNLLVALSTVLGGVLVTYFGFSVLFLAMSMLALVSFVGVLMTPKRTL
ncbi:MAG TPA: MFS transporter [Patescibacteria group bacterium]|nr:MFS transporter [Patescibacteria group bacterium]